MKKDKLKNIFYGVAVLAVIGGLFAWPIVTDKNRPLIKDWKAANIGCIAGHTNLAQHIHTSINISVDGVPENIMGDIGIVRGCMAEIHIHKGQDNYLHVESISPSEKFNLGQFFVVYGKPLMRDGYTLAVTVNGTEYTEKPTELVLEDNQVIEVKYTATSQ